jgi:hypothetical protein
MKDVSLDEISFARWTELVETLFVLRPGSAKPVELMLVSAVRGSDISTHKGKTENFSLIFRGPDNRPLPQQMYVFEHSQLGRFDLFIVPTGRNAEGREYEAIFNRLVRSQ